MALFLGIDVGTSAVKCVLVNDQGKTLAAHSVEYPLLQPHPGWAEQHPEDWWNGTAQCIRSLLTKSFVKGLDIQGIGLSGQMLGSVFLDKQLKVIRPALLWCDQRTEVETEWIEDQIGREALGKFIGSRAMTGFTAPKIVWLREHEPWNYNRIAHILLPKDYIRLKLTGMLATDLSDASGTMLLDVAGRCWSSEMTRRLDICPEWLPPVYESCDIVSETTLFAAATTGLAAGIPVVAGGGDQACGAVGAGVVNKGVASIVLGTSGVISVHDESHQVDPNLLLHSFCHAVSGKWFRMGVMLAAGGSFNWWRTHFGAEEQKMAEASGQDAFDKLTALAAQAPPGSEGLVFLPYLTGERMPHPDPKARGGFIGLNLQHGNAHLTRAVLEGITFGLRDLIGLMKQSSMELHELRVSGGGAQSVFWRQMIADIIGHPVLSARSNEGSAFGAAMLAASPVLKTDLLELSANWIEIVDRLEPLAENQQRYEANYRVYRKLYPLLKQSFHELSEG